MAKYVYSGPVSGKTFQAGAKDKPETKNIMFYPGKTYEDLPEKDAYIQSLIRQKYLTVAVEDQSKKNQEEK